MLEIERADLREYFPEKNGSDVPFNFLAVMSVPDSGGLSAPALATTMGACIPDDVPSTGVSICCSSGRVVVPGQTCP